MSCGLYIVNYKDNERKERMTKRVKQIGLDAHFVKPVNIDDERIKGQPITTFLKTQHMIIVLFVKMTFYFPEI
jgi:bifunctional N-acetylglucosamine-1-phosphate-uridyltransferase/glucosamine-1-phosphate-acetyltransferase GlmU-like protein